MSDGTLPSLASVDRDRIRENLKAFARIGYGRDGSITRLAFTRADLRARQLLVHRMTSLGLEVRIDPFGNVFGRVPGTPNADQPAVLIGSHLDTVPSGGRFDGSVGIVTALEVAALARDQAADLQHPVEIVSFACEESSRFGRGTLGSGIVAGAWEPAEVLELRDARGTTLRQVLQRLGGNPDEVAAARRAPGDFAAYLEIHIEQGRVLEESGTQLGIVEAIAAPTRFRLRIGGQADHAGATPMPLRRDALTGAAEIILAIERCAKAVPGMVSTVGTVRVEPGAINVVPGQVELGFEVRGTEAATKRRVVAEIQDEIRRIADARELTVDFEPLSDEEPVTLDPAVVDILEGACRRRGISSRRMPSGAGHDAMQMAKICPAGMVMVPSRGGISHNRQEWTDPEVIVAGVQVVVDAALELARGGSLDNEPEGQG